MGREEERGRERRKGESRGRERRKGERIKVTVMSDIRPLHNRTNKLVLKKSPG